MLLAYDPVEVHRLLEDQELVELKVHFVQSVLFLIFSLHLLYEYRVVDLMLGIGRGEVISNNFNLIGQLLQRGRHTLEHVLECSIVHLLLEHRVGLHENILKLPEVGPQVLE